MASEKNSFQKAAEQWVDLMDEHNKACSQARRAEKVRSDCATALLEHQKEMKSFVGRNVPEKATVVGDSIVIVSLDGDPRRLPSKGGA